MSDFTERLTRAHTGDEKAREELILENRPLVYAVVKRFEYRGYDREELFQIGMIGLMKAIDRFDTKYEVAFSTYAVPLITGELKRFFRDNSMMKVSRGLKEQGYHIAKAREKIEQEKGRDATLEEISKETGLSTEEILMATEANREVSSLSQSIYEKDGSEISLEEQLSAKGGAVPAGSDQSGEGDYEKEFVVNRILVEQLLGELNEKERKLITLRYFEEKTQVQDNMSRITSYGKQSITDLLGKMNQAENAIDQAYKTEDGKSTKKDKSKVFAGDLNLIDDPVTKKRKEAQQKALKVVKDAWDIDRSIDADIQERRDHYDKMKNLYSEAQDEVLKINDQKKALREQHMVEPDSQEQKDLELLEKRQVCMSGKFNIELTEEEWKRCEEIDKAGLTNYQEQALELNKRSIHFRKELKEAQKGMKEDVAKIKAIRLERLKSDPMVEAEKNADQIMENASKEIIGLLKQEAIDNMDEKQQEAEEKAKDTKEEKKEEEKKLEEQKLERAKQEAMMMQTKEAARKVRTQQKRVEASDADMGEIVTLARDYRQPENVSQTLNEIKNNMKLLEADLKGIQVDEEG